MTKNNAGGLNFFYRRRGRIARHSNVVNSSELRGYLSKKTGLMYEKSIGIAWGCWCIGV